MTDHPRDSMPALPEPTRLLYDPTHGHVYGYTIDQMHAIEREGFLRGVKSVVDAAPAAPVGEVEDTWQRASRAAVSHLDYESDAPPAVKSALRSLSYAIDGRATPSPTLALGEGAGTWMVRVLGNGTDWGRWSRSSAADAEAGAGKPHLQFHKFHGPDWQPIDTCPSNGPVWLWFPEGAIKGWAACGFVGGIAGSRDSRDYDYMHGFGFYAPGIVMGEKRVFVEVDDHRLWPKYWAPIVGPNDTAALAQVQS